MKHAVLPRLHGKVQPPHAVGQSTGQRRSAQGIACLPIAQHAPPLAWILAAIAMIIYAVALPDRYDIACAAYAFTLMVTLAISGETSTSVLAARAWETLIGGVLGVIAAKVILPLPEPSPNVAKIAWTG